MQRSCGPTPIAGLHGALTPNLRFVLRDRAHASKRITGRPWSADAYLKDVVLMFASGRGSVAQLIQHSLDIRRVFANYVKTCTHTCVNTTVTNMRAAKHRFESFAKPLGRSVLHLHACIRTALYVASRGSSSDKPATRARDWLRWLDTEKCVMVAMLADAADESLALTRLLDAENADPAVLNREVHCFHLRLAALFGEGKQCLHRLGYTQTMLELLREQVVWTVCVCVRGGGGW